MVRSLHNFWRNAVYNAPLTIAQAIQLALAPVFLLAAIAGMLSVFTNRLGHIMDRARELRSPAVGADMSSTALVGLARRARLSHHAIALCTGAALCVALVVAAIFIGFVSSLNMATMVAALFITATLLFILALLFLLREVQLATDGLRTACEDDSTESATLGP